MITDGLRGRTTGFDEHLAACDRNGVRILPTSLRHAPLDLVIIMLGSNDETGDCRYGACGHAGMRRLLV